MRFKLLAWIVIMIVLLSILLLGFPLIPAEASELSEDIIIHPNSTRELTIEVKKGTNIEFSWNVSNVSQTVGFKMKGKEEKLPDIQGVKSGGKVEKVEGEKYTFVWTNFDPKEKVTLNYILTYEPKPEEETGCYTSAILISIMVVFIIFSAFSIHQRKR